MKTGHRKDAQSHKNDILGTSSNSLGKSCLLLQMRREALLVKVKISYGQYGYVRTVCWLLRIKIKSVHCALFMLCSFLWKQEHRKVQIMCVCMEQEHLTCAYENIGTTGHELRFNDWKSPKCHSINVFCDSQSAAERWSQQPKFQHTFSGIG